ncbi:MAG: PQQ-binding-like beta-propeller repeat protein [Candidatus Bathyarchaeota archaeon]|nr:PQQ-binding-like beta-propeller repeat protein [Candidatus Bathyarchaeota archaeon]
MKKLNNSKIATIILSTILIISILTVFAQGVSYYSDDAVVSSQEVLAEKINPETGEPYGDVMQYEWASWGNDGANTRFGTGPAPNTGTVLWKSAMPLYSSMFGGSACTAFNGLVYAFTGSRALTAFNITNGEEVWTCNSVRSGVGLFGTQAPVKVTDDVLLVVYTRSLYFVNTTNGELLTETSMTDIGTPFGYTSLSNLIVSYWQVMYDPATQVLIGAAVESETNKHVGVAIDCSQPSSGAVGKWTYYVGTGLEALAIADGKAFFGGYGEGIVFAVDLDTGQEIWRQYKQGNAGYSATYYDGILYHCGSSTQITAFDGNTGAVVGAFDVAGGRAFYAYGTEAAYGRIYANSIESPQGWVSAFDAKTLVQLWKQPAQYYISYMVGCVGDGKLFISASDRSSGNVPGTDIPFDGYHFTAYDVITGQKLWELPVHFVMPIVAYGCVFGTHSDSDGRYIYCIGDVSGGISDFPQSDGWPQFHGPMDTTGTQTGVVSGSYPTNIRTASWSFEADSPVSGSPVVGDGTVFFGSWAGTLYAVDSISGEEVWNRSFNTRLLSTPTIINGVLYTGADDGNVYALNATNGNTIWSTTAGNINDMPTQRTAWQVKSSPLFWNGTLYVAAQDGNLYAINAATGLKQWATTVSSVEDGQGGSLAIHTDLLNRTCLYIQAGGSALTQIDINGTIINSVSVGSARSNHGTPTIVNDYLFLTYGSGAGTIAIYNATSLERINIGTINAGETASTPMTQTPTYIADNVCVFANQTDMGYELDGTDYQYLLNDTTVMNFPTLCVSASTNAVALALIEPGTNLGGSGSSAWIVNSTVPYFVQIWNAWGGHQIFASASVAQVSGTNVFYMGNAAYGFTAYNASSGAVLSTFTALGQVFATAALANNNVYITSNDGHLYAFIGGAQGTVNIYAQSNKGESMLANEATIIAGGLNGYQFFQSQADPNNNATFTPPLENQTVNLIWVNPDGSSEEISTTTDHEGFFNFTYTPTTSGEASWLVYFPGTELASGLNLNEAYTPYTSINVMGESTPGPESPTASSESPPIIPTDYLYIIIGIIVAIIVIVAIVMLLRSRKK